MAHDLALHASRGTEQTRNPFARIGSGNERGERFSRGEARRGATDLAARGDLEAVLAEGGNGGEKLIDGGADSGGCGVGFIWQADERLETTEETALRCVAK